MSVFFGISFDFNWIYVYLSCILVLIRIQVCNSYMMCYNINVGNKYYFKRKHKSHIPGITGTRSPFSLSHKGCVLPCHMQEFGTKEKEEHCSLFAVFTCTTATKWQQTWNTMLRQMWYSFTRFPSRIIWWTASIQPVSKIEKVNSSQSKMKQHFGKWDVFISYTKWPFHFIKLVGHLKLSPWNIRLDWNILNNRVSQCTASCPILPPRVQTGKSQLGDGGWTLTLTQRAWHTGFGQKLKNETLELSVNSGSSSFEVRIWRPVMSQHCVKDTSHAVQGHCKCTLVLADVSVCSSEAKSGLQIGCDVCHCHCFPVHHL